MRKILSLCLLSSLTSFTFAGQNTQGLPADAVGVIAFNLETFNQTKIGQAVWPTIPDTQESALFKQEIGFDPATEIKEFVMGIYAGPDGKVDQKNPIVAGLIRGTFKQDKCEAYAESNGIYPKNVGNLRVWDINEIQKAMGNPNGDTPVNAGALITGAPGIMAFASSGLVEKTVAAIGQPTSQLKLPAGTETYLETVQKPWLFIAMNGSKFADAAKAGVETITVVAGESPTHFQLGIYLNFKNKDLATDTNNKLNALLLLGTMAASSSEDGKTPDEITQQRAVAELVKDTKISTEDTRVMITVNFPADQAAQLIRSAIEKAQANQGAFTLGTNLPKPLKKK